MLLLYPSSFNPAFLDNLKFTFHYASTLSEALYIYRIGVLHLHSTMLLLYPRVSFPYNERDFYLHSTMLLLYHTARCHNCPHNRKFTFHYASTLSCFLFQISSYICFIYIPLCFYFIAWHYPVLIYNDSHLHSTMLLLYPVTVNGIEARTVKIYIPLCFYFIAENLSHVLRGHNLHSTMLLLYPSSGLIKIQSQLIYIPLCFYFIDKLHKDFSLLFPIYIPLCFYFILEQDNTKPITSAFTFHYASTLSQY